MGISRAEKFSLEPLKLEVRSRHQIMLGFFTIEMTIIILICVSYKNILANLALALYVSLWMEFLFDEH